MRILIAEDDAVSRTLLKGLLERFGFEVLVTSGGHEAWERFQRERPKLVITDWLMPDLDGLELTRRIRADRAHHRYVYVMVLTAQSGKRSYMEGMNAGADDFLVKPFDPDELLARLRVAERVLKLEDELSRIEALLPTCPDCRKLKQPDGSWVPLGRAAVKAPASSRPICPDCSRDRGRRALDGLSRPA
ncbi:MAG: response regulator [Gemmatimonadales bacterium]|nr:response regulator [Gemmatimonadales bacterium]